jgi:hypothetical protein
LTSGESTKLGDDGLVPPLGLAVTNEQAAERLWEVLLKPILAGLRPVELLPHLRQPHQRSRPRPEDAEQ